MLEAKKLVLGYGQDDIVRGVDLKLPVGKVTVIAGPNGSGKSTLLKGLSRLLTPKSGGAFLDGKPLGDYPTKDLARRLALLPQAAHAPGGITVKELVSRGRYPHRSMLGGLGPKDEEAITRAMHKTGVASLANHEVGELSGGQRQRAWIAMVLAQETGLLLLDEPTTYLDLTYQIEVLDLLRELSERDGTTVALVLHDLQMAARYGDYLVLMRDGQVAAQGEASTTLTRQVVREVFDLDSQVIADPVSGRPLLVPLRSLRQEAQS